MNNALVYYSPPILSGVDAGQFRFVQIGRRILDNDPRRMQKKASDAEGGDQVRPRRIHQSHKPCRDNHHNVSDCVIAREKPDSANVRVTSAVLSQHKRRHYIDDKRNEGNQAHQFGIW